MAVTCLCWGISLTCASAAHNFGGLLVSRLFLGLFEAGVAPAFIALTQMWFRRREQPLRLGAWVGFMYGLRPLANRIPVCNERNHKHGWCKSSFNQYSHLTLLTWHSLCLPGVSHTSNQT